MMIPRTILAFIRKDFLEETSYRFHLFMGLGGMLLTLLFLAGVSSFVGSAIEEKLVGYEGNYLAFLLLGIGVYSLLDTALRDLSRKIRAAQTQGTLEALLATRTSLPALLLALPVYPFLRTTLRLLGYIGLGIILFDLPLRVANAPALFLIFSLTLLSFGAIGVTFAALTLLFKRTEPFIAVVSSASALLGGVFYPPDILPEFLQRGAQLLPITPALQGMRLALLGDGRWSELANPILWLLASSVVLIPVAALVFRWALRRALRDGTLGQY